MSTEPTTAPRPIPVAKRTPAERHLHVAQRMAERAGIQWTVEQVAALEKKIKLCREMVNHGKTPAPILPTKIAETHEGFTHHYRVMIAGSQYTFAWSQICRGIVSFLGKGEITESLPRPEKIIP